MGFGYQGGQLPRRHSYSLVDQTQLRSPPQPVQQSQALVDLVPTRESWTHHSIQRINSDCVLIDRLRWRREELRTHRRVHAFGPHRRIEARALHQQRRSKYSSVGLVSHLANSRNHSPPAAGSGYPTQINNAISRTSERSDAIFPVSSNDRTCNISSELGRNLDSDLR